MVSGLVAEKISERKMSKGELIKRANLAVDHVNQISCEQGYSHEIVNGGILRKDFTEKDFRQLEEYRLATFISKKRKPETYEGGNPFIPLPIGAQFNEVTLEDHTQARTLLQKFYSHLNN